MWIGRAALQLPGLAGKAERAGPYQQLSSPVQSPGCPHAWNPIAQMPLCLCCRSQDGSRLFASRVQPIPIAMPRTNKSLTTEEDEGGLHRSQRTPPSSPPASCSSKAAASSYRAATKQQQLFVGENLNGRAGGLAELLRPASPISSSALYFLRHQGSKTTCRPRCPFSPPGSQRQHSISARPLLASAPPIDFAQMNR